jgi:hypothetical protein
MHIVQLKVLKNDDPVYGYDVPLSQNIESIDGSKPATCLLRSYPESSLTIFKLNDALNNLQIPLDVDECTIDQKLSALEQWGDKSTPAYWLLTARLAELAVFMAGYYADSCRFSAAGDLLVNPRKIVVRVADQEKPIVKQRHSRLSSQFNTKNRSKVDFMQWFIGNAQLNVVEKPLLPLLYEQLAGSGKISEDYLRKLRERMGKISETIGFMAAWGCTTPDELFARFPSISIRTREFVAANQCNFNTSLFRLLGKAIQNIQN